MTKASRRSRKVAIGSTSGGGRATLHYIRRYRHSPAGRCNRCPHSLPVAIFRHRAHSRQMLEPNREAVLAIQGGGVYGFSLLGQAKTVINRGYIPLAYAGTSAGAV